MRAPALFLCFALAACGPALDDSSSSSATQAIIGGTPAPSEALVFSLNQSGAGFCSATLIGPRTLLTAAHCVAGASPIEVGAFNGATWTPTGADFRAVRFAVHPDWRGTPGNGSDLALVLLKTSPGLAPKPYNRQRLLPFMGQPATVLGYGADESGADGVKKSAGLAIGSVDTEIYDLGYVGKGICFGDSGGPTFFTFPDGVSRVIGVHSFVYDFACSKGADARVDHSLSFIDDFLITHDRGICVPDGFCSDGCENPDPDCACVDTDNRCDLACPVPDLDCGPNTCRADRVCERGCVRPDPDCTPSGAGCDFDSQCEGGRCTMDAKHPDGYCSSPCDATTTCPSGMTCAAGTCKLFDGVTGGPEQPPLPGEDRCLTSDDCEEGFTCKTNSFSGERRCVATPKPSVPAAPSVVEEPPAPVVRASNGTEDDPPAQGCASAPFSAALLPLLSVAALLRRRTR